MNKFSKKLSYSLASLMLMLTLSVVLVNPLEAQYTVPGQDDGSRKLRTGSCWIDGKPNCRKKKTGKECASRKGCSAQSVVTLIGGVLGAAAAIDNLKK